ncbi:CASP8 and FADD-like apoptosis regulator a [Silurus meridionalis]|nr:CASP8 and FADD-like apoptosis regulator a [Silurus meridionalis]
MSLSTDLLRTIHRIAEELNPEECKRLTYLCREFHTERSSASVKEMLQSCIVRMNTNQIFLMELMLRMKRYDLLSELLGISKSEAERLLENSHKISDYRVLMADLSEDVGSDDLESLVFLLRGTLPKEKVEKFECFLDVVVELEKMNQISSTRVDMMEKYLRTIQRVDLAKRLNQYQSRAHTTPQCLFYDLINVHTHDVNPYSTPFPLSVFQLHTSAAFTPTSSCTRKSTPCASHSQFSVIIPSTLLGCCSTRFWSVIKEICAHLDTRVLVKSGSDVGEKQWEEEVYRMRSDPRGVCVIIDCVGNEGVQLERLFSSLHFRVSLYMLLSVEDVRSCLQKVAKQADHCSMDAFVCCIISRSNSSRLLATDSSGLGLDLNIVRQFFTHDWCPGLTEKPKLFFIQGYEVSQSAERNGLQDYEEGELETDSPVHYYRERDVPKDADVFWSHCWTNEKQLEDNNHHSVYLKSLKKALVDGQKGRIHLVDLHTMVNRDVYAYNRSHPGSAYHINLKHTLRKNVYVS